MPDFTDLVGAPINVHTDQLRRTGYDTAERHLARLGLQLEHISGEASSWTFGYLEATHGLATITDANGSVPDALAALTVGARAGHELLPVTITTEARTEYGIGHGDVFLGTVVDTDASRTMLGNDAVATRSREITMRLVAPDPIVEEAIEARLLAAGARPAGIPRTTRRAQHVAYNDVLEYLRAQHAALIEGDVAFRQSAISVHDTRVAVRRFRSTLRVFAHVFEGPATSRLDEELAWYAALLGAVRDREVQREHLAAAIHALPDALVMGPVAARVEERLLGEELRHREELNGELTQPRYLALLDQILQWIDVAAAAKPPADPGNLHSAARRAHRTALKRLRRAVGSSNEDSELHRARKSAKRGRYAAEALLGGGRHRKVHEKARTELKALQEFLGDHHDAVEVAAFLRQMGATAGTTTGENGFTYGLLYAYEQQRAASARAEALRMSGR